MNAVAESRIAGNVSIGNGAPGSALTLEARTILDVCRKHLPPDGVMNWKAVWAAEPEAAATLRANTPNGMAKVYYWVAKFKKQGMFTTNGAPAQPAPAGTDLPNLTVRHRQAYDLVRGHVRLDGTIDWKAAAAANPSLAAKVIGKNKQAAYNVLTAIKKKGLLLRPEAPAEAPTSQAPVPVRRTYKRKLKLAVATAEQVTPTQPAPPEFPLNFCPGCGLGLRVYLMAAKFAARL